MARRHRRRGASGHCGGSSTPAKAQRCITYTAEAAASRRIRALLEQQAVTADIIQLFHETYGQGALADAWDRFRCWGTEATRDALIDFTAESPFLELFGSWLAHTWTPAALSVKPEVLTVMDYVPTRAFLEQHSRLDPSISKYLKACIEAPFSFYEVLACAAGRGFSCCDLVCGTRHLVPEGRASTLLSPHQILFARIIEVDGVTIMDVAAPFPIPESLKSAIHFLREEILHGATCGDSAELRQRLSAHELAARSFYWAFVDSAFKDGSLRLPVRYSNGTYTAAEDLLMTLASGRVTAEVEGENERVLRDPEVREKFANMIRASYESWVSERLPVFGNKTALEVVATPEGRSQVEAVLAEIESVMLLLPVPLDPQVYRRMRERLGLLPARRPH